MQQAVVFELDIVADALAVEAGEDSGGGSTVEAAIVIEHANPHVEPFCCLGRGQQSQIGWRFGHGYVKPAGRGSRQRGEKFWASTPYCPNRFNRSAVWYASIIPKIHRRGVVMIPMKTKISRIEKI